jgi:hypothetical protein
MDFERDDRHRKLMYGDGWMDGWRICVLMMMDFGWILDG